MLQGTVAPRIDGRQRWTLPAIDQSSPFDGSRTAIRPYVYELTVSDVLAGALLPDPETLGEDKTKSA